MSTVPDCICSTFRAIWSLTVRSLNTTRDMKQHHCARGLALAISQAAAGSPYRCVATSRIVISALHLHTHKSDATQVAEQGGRLLLRTTPSLRSSLTFVSPQAATVLVKRMALRDLRPIPLLRPEVFHILGNRCKGARRGDQHFQCHVYRLQYSYCYIKSCGPGSSVGIATNYGLDDPGSNPVGDEIFRKICAQRQASHRYQMSALLPPPPFLP